VYRIALKSYIFIVFIIFQWDLKAQNNKNELHLTGIAIQEKYRIPILYAAIYSKKKLSLSELFSLNQPFRMESRYLVNKYSRRQNHRL